MRSAIRWSFRGRNASEQAAPHYIDDRIGAGIIKEMPDDKRFCIEVSAGEEIVTESIAPRV